MSSRRVGVVRDSMLTNPLIIEAPLGRARSRGHHVPAPDFTYGTCYSIREGGVAEALSSWRVHACSPHRHANVPDFVCLNREAVRSGLVTAKELGQYRAQWFQTHATKQPTSSQQSRRGGANITPGTSHRVKSPPPPPPPIFDLLSHHYGRRWLEEQQSRNQTSNQEKQQRIKAGHIPDTRTSLLRRSRALPQTHTSFILPRFRQVPPALDTFRTMEDRCRAFGIHQPRCVQERRPPCVLLSRADSAGERCSPPELSPRSDSSSGGSSEPVPRLEPHLLPGRLQHRTVSSSFLIRDILADCRSDPEPGQVCSELGQPGPGAEPFQSGPEEENLDKSRSRSSDGEFRDQGGVSDRGAGLKKPRKARTAFSDQQLARLERNFQKQKYLNVQDRMELAATLQLSDTQVKTWYQNRRTKWKRHSAAGLELLAEADRMFPPPHYLFLPAPPQPPPPRTVPAAPRPDPHQPPPAMRPTGGRRDSAA
ncbi:hypothetical protein LDENG_00221360 [Lucifuga dentata]|nr:hypothetical protein LDENG_00221360 [Lucifuga dentata]